LNNLAPTLYNIILFVNQTKIATLEVENLNNLAPTLHNIILFVNQTKIATLEVENLNNLAPTLQYNVMCQPDQDSNT